MKNKKMGLRLKFVEGMKFLGVYPVTKKDGSLNEKMKNFRVLSFVNDKKQFKGIQIRETEVEEYLLFIDNQKNATTNNDFEIDYLIKFFGLKRENSNYYTNRETDTRILIVGNDYDLLLGERSLNWESGKETA